MLTRRNLIKILAIAALAMGSSSARAGFLKAELAATGTSQTLVNATGPSSETPPAKNSAPVEVYLQKNCDLCEPSGVGNPNVQNSVSNSAGAATTGTSNGVYVPRPQFVTQLALAANFSLPPPLAHRLFRPPKPIV